MEVRVRYFAAAKDLCGCEQEQIVVNADTVSISALLALLCDRHPPLRPHLGRLRLAINAEFSDPNDLVTDGDEVSVLPPLAGGSAATCDIRQTPLSLDEAVAAVSHPGAGGIAIFLGVVRDHADGRSVSKLDYEAHDEMAAQELRRVLEEIMAEQTGVRVCALHRIGALRVGDTAVIVAASAPHRANAFAACRNAIDRIKERVPIWKKEWDADGMPHWVNLEQ